MDNLERDKSIVRLRSKGSSTDDVAEQLGITRGVVCGVWYRYNQGRRPELTPDTPPPPEKILHLEQWQFAASSNQRGEWEQAQAKLERDTRYIIAEHDNDNHFPYHDEAAQALRSQIRQRLQPHVIVVGSDAADFPDISRFELDRRLSVGGTLKRFRLHWWPHIGRLKHDAPHALLRWIDGNHDERAWLHIEKDLNYDILFDYHVATIQAHGEVFWAGNSQADLEVNIADTLIVTHGWKASVHTASAMLREYNNQYSVLAGHSHRPDYYTRASKYKVTCVVGGCGCGLNPPYDRRKRRTHWQNGYSYGVVDTQTQTSILEHVDFYHTDSSIWCWFNNEVVSVDKAQVVEQAA